MLRVLTLHYKVASSQLAAPQIAARTKVVLQSRQFSSSSSPDTPRTKVALQSRQFSASSSRTKVVLQSRQLYLPAPQILRVLKLYYKVASSQPPAPQMLGLPRNLHMEAHKVPRLLRNLRMEVHKALRLPGNLHMEVTKCCACHEICAWRFTTAAPATKSSHGGSQSAVPATKSALQETTENSNHNGGTIPSMIRP